MKEVRGLTWKIGFSSFGNAFIDFKFKMNQKEHNEEASRVESKGARISLVHALTQIERAVPSRLCSCQDELPSPRLTPSRAERRKEHGTRRDEPPLARSTHTYYSERTRATAGGNKFSSRGARHTATSRRASASSRVAASPT